MQSERGVVRESAQQHRFSIRLLGGFEIRGPQGPTLLPTRKAEGVVAIVALQPGEAIERDKLCGLLWPDVRDAQALHSLRQTLMYIRRAIGDVLRTDLRTVTIAADMVEIDVAKLRMHLALGTRNSLIEAAQLYRGDLMDGVTVREQPFEAFLTVERERLRSTMIRGLRQLVDLHDDSGDIPEALEACSLLLQFDPLNEKTHRTYMRLQLRQGQRATALAHYRKLLRTLRSELGTEPDAETRRLHTELENGGTAAALDESRIAATARISAFSVNDEGEPLILRDSEVAELIAARAAALAGRARGCLVLGEAGVGKTRLCQQFTSVLDAEGAQTLRARCFESEQVLPFSLWANLLSDAQRRVPGVMEGMPDIVRAQLARLLPGGESITRTRRVEDHLATFRALEVLLRRIHDRAPLTLILEDLHWADDMSMRALCYVVRRGTGFWIGTARPEDIASQSFLQAALSELDREQSLVRVDLSPFSQSQSFELARLWINHLQLPTAPESWIQQVWLMSEGNALAIVESIRACAQEAQGGARDHLSVPERVRDLIQQRVRRVSPAARELLGLAAVHGRELDLSLAGSAMQPEQLATAAEEVVDSWLMRPNRDCLEFIHDRVRETLYNEMLSPRRRLLHARLARALQQQPGVRSSAAVGQIGYHYSKAGSAPEAISFLVRFAEEVQRGHALVEAFTALEQASRNAAQLDEPERTRVVVELVIRKGFCLAFMGRSQELVELLERHVRELDCLRRPDLAAPFHFWWAFGLTLLGDQQRAEDHARRSLEYATACGEQRCLAFAHGILAYHCGVTARWNDGVEHGEKSLALIDPEDEMPEGVVLAAINTHMNYLGRGDWEKALAAARLAAARACDAGSERGESLAATAEASVYLQLGQWPAALASAQRALDKSNTPLTFAFALWTFARAQLGSGKCKLAIETLKPMLNELKTRGVVNLVAPVMTTLAEATLRDENAREALCHAEDALRLSSDGISPLTRGSALRILGCANLALGQHDLARQHLFQALSTFEKIEATFDVARTLAALAQLEHEQGHAGAAATHLRRACALYSARGAKEQADRVSRQLQQMGIVEHRAMK